MKTIVIGTSTFGYPVSDYFKELGASFSEKGYKVIYILDGKVKNLPQNTQKLLYFTWPNRRPTQLKDFVFFYKMIKKYKPSICISNFGSTNVIAIISYLWRVKYRINYVHTTSKAIENDSKNLLKSKYLRFRKRFVYNLFTHFFTNSEGTKTDVQEVFHVNDDKTHVLPLLVESSKINYVDKNNRNNTLVIVGGLTPTKGHLQLLNQFSNCLEKHPYLKLKIIGNGYLKNEIEEKIVTLKLQNSVHIIGRLSNKNVQIEFSKAMFSISSSIDEAYGLVNIEALREGTPLICTKTAGSLDILKEGYNGEYYNIDNNFALCASVSKVWNDWENYSKNSLASFSNAYLMDTNVSKHLDKIINILKL